MSSMLIKAFAFAAEKHKDQRRKNIEASPYINHPIALANVLANEGGVTDENILCAAILHDTIEDTNTSANELRAVFGEKIASIVLEVTDDKSIADKALRKQLQIEHAPHISTEAKQVKLADKISNLRDILSSPPHGWPVERKQAYFDWAQAVIAGVRGTNPKLEAIFDELVAKNKAINP